MKILIKITKEVLETTANCSGFISQNCAFAYALRSVFPGASVGCSTAEILNEVIEIPADMSHFIFHFDHRTPDERRALPEQSFELEIPDYIIEKIGISEAKAIIEKSKTLELVP